MLFQVKKKHLLGFNDLPIALVGIPLVAFFMPLLFFDSNLDNGLAAYWPKWKVALVFTCFYWITMRWFVLRFRSRFPEYKDTSKRILLMILTTIVLVLLLNNFCYDIHDLLLPNGHQGNTTKFDYAKSTFMVVFFVLSLYEGVYFYHRWRLSLIETERLRQENISSQLDALKSQVNPHFLFNSLNTLVYLIPEDEDRAVRFVQRLSKVYRYILEIRDRSLITVAEELDFLDAYQFLLKERFETLVFNLKSKNWDYNEFKLENELKSKISNLKEVKKVTSFRDLIPENQEKKIEILNQFKIFFPEIDLKEPKVLNQDFFDDEKKS